MSVGTKKALAYAPIALFLALDIWAFTTGTYASNRDKVLPFYFAILSIAYMIPSIVAAHRDHSWFILLWLVNLVGSLFFCLGWIGALIWAFIDPAKRIAESARETRE